MIPRNFTALFIAGLLAAPCSAKSPTDDAGTRGIVLLAQGHYKEAVTAFDAAIKRDPHDAGALANRCTARYKSGDTEGAILDYETAVKLKPGIKAALAPLSVGMILATAWSLARVADSSWGAAVLTAATVVILLTRKINPLWLIAAGALIGMTGWI